MNEKKKKTEEISLGDELRKIQGIPFVMLSIQLGIKPEAAKLIQTLIRDFLSGQEEEAENPDRPTSFHKSGCACRW